MMTGKREGQGCLCSGGDDPHRPQTRAVGAAMMVGAFKSPASPAKVEEDVSNYRPPDRACCLCDPAPYKAQRDGHKSKCDGVAWHVAGIYHLWRQVPQTEPNGMHKQRPTASYS